MHSSAQGKKNV